jgi:dolichyl-phosphate mannosyltransferase polypeptide 2 regulatory subunit
MLLVATAIFLYYTAWTLLMVRRDKTVILLHPGNLLTCFQPFVDPGHPLHDLFPPRVWAIRIPVILTILGSAVVGSFLGIVMIRSNRKKAAKAKAAAKKKA